MQAGPRADQGIDTVSIRGLVSNDELIVFALQDSQAKRGAAGLSATYSTTHPAGNPSTFLGSSCRHHPRLALLAVGSLDLWHGSTASRGGGA